MNGNHSPEIQVTPNRGVGGERWRASLPAAAAIGPGATAGELANLGAEFPPPAGGNAGWVFANGGALAGTLTVRHYDAFEISPIAGESPAAGGGLCNARVAPAGDCVEIRYDNVVGGAQVNPVAPNVLRWIQMICTNYPMAGKLACPPAAGGYRDGDPVNAGVLPFYYTEPSHAAHSGPGNVPPLDLEDRPQRPFPRSRAPVHWSANLYLVEWNGVIPNPAAAGPNGVVTIHGGVQWGFDLTCVAIRLPPGTFVGGGADRDFPDTEVDGVEPNEPPTPECIDTAGVPTLSEWGLLVGFGVLMTSGIITIFNRRWP